LVSLLGDSLLNNPVGLTLLIAGIVLIAVAVILYFLVFKKKIDAKIKTNKVARGEKEVKDAKAQTLAGNVFKEEEERASKGLSDEERTAFDKKFDAIANSKRGVSENERNFGSQVTEKKVAKDKDAKGKEEAKNSDGGFNVMNQFGNKKD